MITLFIDLKKCLSKNKLININSQNNMESYILYVIKINENEIKENEEQQSNNGFKSKIRISFK